MLTSQTTGDKLSEQYTYYLNGNQKSKTSNGTTTVYEYDKMNRLISENDTDYSFDDFGNRISMTNGTVTTSYTYDLNNRLSESNEVNGDITTNTKFFYDNNGNQITKAVMVNQPYAEGMSGDYTISNTSDSFVALYEYNCYNQLVGVDTNGVVSNYAYAPDGLRHSKTVGGNTITFVYDNANVVEEITADSTNKYYRGIEIIKNDDNLYYLYNGQGDVSLLINNAGTTVADYAFDAYGNQSQENTIYNPFGYRGEYTDTESGLIYLRARMYSPNTGTFITEDPIKDGLNWYVYCENNPILFVDQTGEKYEFANPWIRQKVIWENGVFALECLGFYVSAQMLHHSIRWFYAEDVNIKSTSEDMIVSGTDRINGETVVNMLKNSHRINNEIDWLTKCYGDDGETYFLWQGVLSLNETTDSYLSFNNATVTLIGNKELNGVWNVNVNVYDIYDFDREKIEEINSFESAIGSAAGTYAWIEQIPLLGAIKTYDINVNFDVTR